jgi:uncharacterized coiled-coil protein SlyX
MSDLPRPSQRRLEFQARKIEQLELVIASQSDLISLLRSQLHIHSESTLLLQRRFGDACTRSSATSALAATVATANATPSPPYPVTTPADAEPPSSTYPPTPLRSSRSSGFLLCSSSHISRSRRFVYDPLPPRYATSRWKRWTRV